MRGGKTYSDTETDRGAERHIQTPRQTEGRKDSQAETDSGVERRTVRRKDNESDRQSITEVGNAWMFYNLLGFKS